MDKVGEEMLSGIEDTELKVDWGKRGMYNMIGDGGEWVICGEGVWGVGLGVFYGENGDMMMRSETVKDVGDLFEGN
ncbi:class I tRNA ligase family protein, partial [Staphylococcus saprophyticus]|uniref:class I tRNA ligase family protein n=1 Tax=Staphylococcus saprophyticus TaxID=29385 RepID=UPI003703C2B0